MYTDEEQNIVDGYEKRIATLEAELAAVREQARREGKIEALKELERQCELNAQNPEVLSLQLLDGSMTVTNKEIRRRIAALEAQG